MMALISEVKMDILRSLSESPSHGYKLHKDVGVATSTVYSHLEELEDAGMVESESVDNSPKGKVEYRITDKGRELLELLDE